MSPCCTRWGKSSSEADQALLWDPPDLSGWLDKEGRKNANWKRRFFVLKGSNFFWFDGQGASKPRGFIPLEGATITCRTVVNRNGEKPYAVNIQLPVQAYDSCSRQQLTVAAISDELQMLWHRALTQASIPRPELLARLHQEGRLDEVTGGRLTVASAPPAPFESTWPGLAPHSHQRFHSVAAVQTTAPLAPLIAGGGGEGYHASLSFRPAAPAAATAASAAGGGVNGSRGLDRGSRTPFMEEQNDSASATSYASEPAVQLRRMTAAVGAHRQLASKSEMPQRHGYDAHGGAVRSHRGRSRDDGGGRVPYADCAEGAPLLGNCGGGGGSSGGSDDVGGGHWDNAVRRNTTNSRLGGGGGGGDDGEGRRRDRSSTYGEGAGGARRESGTGPRGRSPSMGSRRGGDNRKPADQDDSNDESYDRYGAGNDPRDSRRPSAAMHRSHSSSKPRRSSASPPHRRSFTDANGSGGGGGERRSQRRSSYAGRGRGEVPPSPSRRRGDADGSVTGSGTGSLLDAYLEQQAPLASSAGHRTAGSADEYGSASDCGGGGRGGRDGDHQRDRRTGGGGGRSSARPSSAVANSSNQHGDNGAGRRSVSPNTRGSVSWATKPQLLADPRVSQKQSRSSSAVPAAAAAPSSHGSSAGAGRGGGSTAGSTSSASAQPARASGTPAGAPPTSSQRPSRAVQHGPTAGGESPHVDSVSEQQMAMVRNKSYVASLESQISGLQQSVATVQAVLVDMHTTQQQQAAVQVQAQAQAQLQQLAQAQAQAQMQLQQLQVAAAEARASAMLQQQQQQIAASLSRQMSQTGAAGIRATGLSDAQTRERSMGSIAANADTPPKAAAGAAATAAAAAAAREQERAALVQMQHTLLRMLPVVQQEGEPSTPAATAHYSGHDAATPTGYEAAWHNAVADAAASVYSGSAGGGSSVNAPYYAPAVKTSAPPPPPPPPPPALRTMTPPTPPMPFANPAAAPQPPAQGRAPPPIDLHAELLDQIRNQAEFKFKNHVRRESLAPVTAAPDARPYYHPSSPYYEAHASYNAGAPLQV